MNNYSKIDWHFLLTHTFGIIGADYERGDDDD